MGFRARAGVIALLLLVGTAGCGDDDADRLSGASKGNREADASDGSDGNGGGDGADPCSLLEVSEIEDAFGDHGAVAEGKRLGFACSWEVGAVGERGSGAVGVTQARGAGAPEQSMAEIRDLADNPIEVEGVGDEAFFDAGSLWFRSGPITFSVTAYFSFDDDSGKAERQEKLTGLAQLVLDRA